MLGRLFLEAGHLSLQHRSASSSHLSVDNVPDLPGTSAYMLKPGQPSPGQHSLLRRQPPLLPRYALGNWWSRYWPYTSQEYTDLMDRFKAEGVPLAVSVIDMDWHKTAIPARFGSGWTGYSWNRVTDSYVNQHKTQKKNLLARNLHPLRE